MKSLNVQKHLSVGLGGGAALAAAGVKKHLPPCVVEAGTRGDKRVLLSKFVGHADVNIERQLPGLDRYGSCDISCKPTAAFALKDGIGLGIKETDGLDLAESQTSRLCQRLGLLACIGNGLST